MTLARIVGLGFHGAGNDATDVNVVQPGCGLGDHGRSRGAHLSRSATRETGWLPWATSPVRYVNCYVAAGLNAVSNPVIGQFRDAEGGKSAGFEPISNWVNRPPGLKKCAGTAQSCGRFGRSSWGRLPSSLVEKQVAVF